MINRIETSERTEFNLGIFDTGDLPYLVQTEKILRSPVIAWELQNELRKNLHPDNVDLETQEIEKIEAALRTLFLAGISKFMRTMFHLDDHESFWLDYFKNTLCAGERLDRRSKVLWGTYFLYEISKSTGLLDTDSISRIDDVQNGFNRTGEEETFPVDFVRVGKVALEEILSAISIWHTNNPEVRSNRRR